MNRPLLLASGVFLLFGCGPVTPPATESDVIQHVFGTAENLDLMRSATKVTACRIKPKAAEEPVSGDQPQARNYDDELNSYDEAPFIDASPEQAERFKTVLARPDSYKFQLAKSCMPVYGVRLRFESEAGAVEAHLCFDCLILLITRNGKIVGGEDFDGGASELTALCKELFPNDSEIQSLKSR